MPAPSTSITSLRPDLAGPFEEFSLEANQLGFIGQQVLPVTEVAKASGTFGKIPIEQLLKNRDTARAPGSGYARSNFTFTKDTFACEEHGAEEPIDDRESTLYNNFLDPPLIAAARARYAVLENMERRIAAAVFNATTWTAATTGITNEWDDATNAVPVTDVNTAVAAIWDATGLWANCLIINRKVFRSLRTVAQIQDLISSSGAGSSELQGNITVQQLSQAFDLPYILVAGGAKDSAAEGQATSIAPIWSDEYAMVCKLCTGPDLREPGIGRMFHWAEDGSQIGATMETYRDETVRSDIVRARHDVDEKILYVGAGHLLSNVTTI